MTWTGKAKAFWPLLSVLALADCSTKRLAVAHLSPYVPHDVVGDVLRLTLAYNKGAATGVTFGPHSRVALAAFAIVALLALIALYHRSPASDLTRAAGLGLIAGGALGNLFDRLRSPRGVVDFIDLGIGEARFWTFNVADVGITFGALLLVVLLARERPSTTPSG